MKYELQRLQRQHEKLRLKYASAIGLLCECSVQVDDDTRDGIEAAVAEFCTATGWSYKWTIHRIEVFPPREEQG